MSKHIFSKPRVANAVSALQRSVSSANLLASSLPRLQKTLDGQAPPAARPVFRALEKSVLSAAEADGRVEVTITGQDLADRAKREPNIRELFLIPRARRNERIEGEIVDFARTKIVAKFDLKGCPPGEYQIAYRTGEDRLRLPTLSLTLQAADGRSASPSSRPGEAVALGGVLPDNFSLRGDSGYVLLSVLSGEPDTFALSMPSGEELAEFDVRPPPPAMVKEKAPHLAHLLDASATGPRRILLQVAWCRPAGQPDPRITKQHEWLSARLVARCSKTGSHDVLEFFVPAALVASAPAP